MKYRTRERTEYDIECFNDKEKQVLDWLLREYESARSWVSFESRTGNGIVSELKRISNDKWQEHPLYKIQKDLVENAGVRNKELVGELSDMIVEN